jgi:hypothetical protein
MLRLVITILACLMFLVFGAVGDELLNFLPHTKTDFLPALTQIVVHSFPLNQYDFFWCVSPVFCAAMFIVLLLTSSKKPIIAPHHFAEGALLVLILFGLYFGCFLLAIIMPFHLLLAAMDNQPMTALNIGTRILNYALWLVVAALVVRLIINRFRKGP